MATYSPVAGRIILCKEDVYGATPASPTYKTIGLISTGVTVDDINNVAEIPGQGHRTIQDTCAGRYGVTGTFDYTVQDGMLFYFSLGKMHSTSPVSNTPTTGVTQHYVEQSDTAVMPSFTLHAGIEIGGTDKVLEVEGCKITSHSVRWNLDAPLTASVSFTGEATDISNTTAQSVTEQTVPVWMYPALGTVVDVNGTDEKATVTACDFTITDTVRPVYGMGGRMLTDLHTIAQTIAGTMTLNFEDFDQYELFLSSAASPTAPATTGDVKEFNGYITAGNEAAGSETTAYRGIRFDFTNMRFNTHSHRQPRTEEVTQTFGFVAEDMTVKYHDVTATDPY